MYSREKIINSFKMCQVSRNALLACILEQTDGKNNNKKKKKIKKGLHLI